jgi:hypothetical protein
MGRRAYRDTPTAPPRQRPAPPPPRDRFSGVLAVQRLAGNRATRRLLRDDKPGDIVPKGIDPADAHPLPKVAGPTAGATVKADSSLPGGWEDADGKTSSGYVGKMKRILLDGLPGDQREQPAENVKPHDDAGTFAHAVGKGAKHERGRAVAIVPPDLKSDSGEVAVIVHFHGIDLSSDVLGSMGMRSRDRPEDVADFQIPQQLEAFVTSRKGARAVVLMPLGVTVPAGKGYTVDFGISDLDSYVAACLGKLGLDRTPDGIYLSAHSGGGFTISGLGTLPKSVRGILGFESFHSADAESWAGLATTHLDAAVKDLQKIRDKGGGEDAIAAAQLKYLSDAGFRFLTFGGGKYMGNIHALRGAIVDWFNRPDVRRKLAKAMGGKVRDDVLTALWANFQATDYGGSTHMNALSLDSHFGQALAALPRTGALAGATGH